VRLLAVASLALVACNAPRSETSSKTEQPLQCAPAATGIDARESVDRDLTRTTWSPRGNHHPVARFVHKSLDLGEGTAAIAVAGGAALVREDGTLELFDARGCSRAIASDALPDLTASPDGRTIAFVRPSGLSLYRDGNVRRIASAYAEADRPLFIDDRTLLFVGSARPGVSSFHRVSLDDELPHALAIEGIPATRDGYTIVNGVVRFHDGEIFRSAVVR